MKYLLALLAVLASTTPTRADVEVGAFAGAHIFSHDNELGAFDSPSSPSLGNSFLPGLRVGAFFTDAIGVEGELGVLPTNARITGDHYAVTALTYRAHLIVQLRAAEDDNQLIPFLLAGVGGFTIVSNANKTIPSSNRSAFLDAHDTDPAGYLGVGAKYRISPAWGLRADARLLLPPSSKSTGVTADVELLASVYLELDRHPHAPQHVREPEKVVPVVIDDDPDRDGIRGAADKCPNDPEDRDGFEDADGCPDPDNDKDGILDAQDRCPNEPETKNGYQDEDGCPDEVPVQVKQFTGAIQGITFKVSSADLTPESDAVLDKAIAVLVEYKDVKLEVQGHADDQPLSKNRKYADNLALSQARAETVKAYLVGKGIDAARLSAKGYGDTVPLVDPKAAGTNVNAARGKNRRVEFKLIP